MCYFWNIQLIGGTHMKNFIIKTSLLLISIIFVFTASSQITYAEATPSATVFIDGKEIYPSPIMINNSLLIPLRVCSETLGAKTTWDKNTKKILIKKENTDISFSVNSKEYVVNDIQLELNTAPFVKEDITYVPFRALLENLNYTIIYNKDFQFVNSFSSNSEMAAIYKDLKSDDLNKKRLAMMSLPMLLPDNISAIGSRETTYIFPLNKFSNYFFTYYSLYEGENTGLGYFEIVDGVAVKKWNQEYQSPTRTNESHPLLSLLGKSNKCDVNYGSFPDIEDQKFVGFYNVQFSFSTIDYEYLNSIPLGVHASIIDSKGSEYLSESTPAKLIMYEHVLNENYPTAYLVAFDESIF